MPRDPDRSGRRMAMLFLTSLFRASGLAVVALAAAPYAGVASLRPDPLLLAALGGLAVFAFGVRGLLRRGLLDPRGTPMAIVLLLMATALTLCIQRTGGLFSPLLILLGILATAGALLLAPVANLFALSGFCLLQTVMVIASADGRLPPALLPADTPARVPFTLLAVVLGFTGMISVVVNGLAWRLRAQQDELACRDLRDPDTGTLRSSFFHARLVALLDGRAATDLGVTALLIDLGDASEEEVYETGALLLDNVRGDDLVGRVGRARFAVAVTVASAERGVTAARRLERELKGLGLGTVHTATAHLAGAADEDPVESARKLFATAESQLTRAA